MAVSCKAWQGGFHAERSITTPASSEIGRLAQLLLAVGLTSAGKAAPC
ncbi:MAG: hypothetical protein R2725_10850 [Solirubrobacterales bacterium]